VELFRIGNGSDTRSGYQGDQGPAGPSLPVLADYDTSHPAILPKRVFSDLVVEQGGVGAGTVVRVTMAAMGTKQELT
jgi:hypothetical protein